MWNGRADLAARRRSPTMSAGTARAWSARRPEPCGVERKVGGTDLFQVTGGRLSRAWSVTGRTWRCRTRTPGPTPNCLRCGKFRTGNGRTRPRQARVPVVSDVPARTPPAPSGPPTRMQRRRLATRARLVAAALSLFTERGYDGTTMDMVADRADLARTTVFNHFPRKDALLLAALAALADRRAIVGDRLTQTRAGQTGAGDRIRDAVGRWAAPTSPTPAPAGRHGHCGSTRPCQPGDLGCPRHLRRVAPGHGRRQRHDRHRRPGRDPVAGIRGEPPSRARLRRQDESRRRRCRSRSRRCGPPD
jgi:AcrR family transcriptional regulator